MSLRVLQYKEKAETNTRSRSRYIDDGFPEGKPLPDKEKVHLRMSTELEWRELEFIFYYEEDYNAYTKLLDYTNKYHNPESYWEGFAQNHLYVEAQVESKAWYPEWVLLYFEPGDVQQEFLNFIETYSPQTHRPRVKPQYVDPEVYYKPVRKFPEQYICTGFAKHYHTQYDQEMQHAYNILPGFSTPIPDVKTIQYKLRAMVRPLGKGIPINIMRAFDCDSILDVGNNIEMLYHISAAIDQTFLNLGVDDQHAVNQEYNRISDIQQKLRSQEDIHRMYPKPSGFDHSKPKRGYV